jgi:hypothetical protein
MNIAYLIIAHNNPKHLQRLISALSSESSAFFIHIDRKSNMDDFLRIRGKNVQFCSDRIRSYWGDFSVVRAILGLIRMAIADDRNFNYFPLLSGTDYPVQPTSYIETSFRRLRRQNRAEFINIVQMPCEEAGKPISRLTSYKHSPEDSRVVIKWRRRLVDIGLIPGERNCKAHLRGLTPYGGSTWWALSREACNYILNFVDKNPRIVNFFKHTCMPDEAFFQTILGNSPFRSRLQRGLTYANWETGGAHPSLVSEKDLELFKVHGPIVVSDIYGKGEILFARKFSDESVHIVAKINQIIMEKERKI